MKLIRAEFRKLFSSRFPTILLAVLLTVNFAVTLVISRPRPYDDVVHEVFDEYTRSPEAVEAYYAELLELVEVSVKDEPILPHTYTGDAECDDLTILMRVFERVRYIEGYEGSLERLIALTETKITDLKSYGYSERTYTTKSQIYLRDAYLSLTKGEPLALEYAYGYDTYLQNSLVFVFIILFLTVMPAYIFLHDRDVGFGSVLKSTKRGGLSTGVAKLVCALVSGLAVTLAFLLTAFAAVGLVEGFSSPMSDIRLFPDFVNAPERLGILQYLLRHTLIRLCAAALYVAFISLLASSGLSYISCFAGGALFTVANAFLFYRSYAGTVPSIKYLNLAAMVEGCELTDFYRTVSVFKLPVRTHTVMITVCLLFTVLLGALSVVIFRYRRSGKAFSLSLPKLLPAKGLAAPKPRLRARGLRLPTYELAKLRPILIFLLVLILFAARLCYVDRTVGDMEGYGEALYFEYVETLSEMSPEARRDYLDAEGQRLGEVISSYRIKTELYNTGKLSEAEYSAFLQDYYRCAGEKPSFDRARDYAEYIESQNKKSGLDGELIYTTGYEKLFSLTPDLFLFAALLLIGARSFAAEYDAKSSSSGFSQILRTTKKGRRQTFSAKLAVNASLGAALAILFRVGTLLTVAGNYVLPGASALLYSIELFRPILSGMTIGRYLALDILSSAVSGALMSALILSVSFFLKRAVAVLSVSVLLIGLPELLGKTVLRAISPFGLLALTSPRELFCGYWGEKGLALVIFLHLIAVLPIAFVAFMKYTDLKFKQR